MIKGCASVWKRTGGMGIGMIEMSGVPHSGPPRPHYLIVHFRPYRIVLANGATGWEGKERSDERRGRAPRGGEVRSTRRHPAGWTRAQTWTTKPRNSMAEPQDRTSSSRKGDLADGIALRQRPRGKSWACTTCARRAGLNLSPRRRHKPNPPRSAGAAV